MVSIKYIQFFKLGLYFLKNKRMVNKEHTICDIEMRATVFEINEFFSWSTGILYVYVYF